MSTPHEYFDEHGRPHLVSRGDNVLYRDLDWAANEADDQLPLISSIGAGPRGLSLHIAEDPNNSDETGTYKFDIVNDFEEVESSSPNLHAGKLYIVVDNNLNNGGQVPETEEGSERQIHFYVKRDNVSKLLSSISLPKGQHGSRIYTAKQSSVYDINPETYVANINMNEIYYHDESVNREDQPLPSIWDIVLAWVKHPEGWNAFAAGLVLNTSSDNTTCTISFRSVFKISEQPSVQEQVDFNETDDKKVTFIKNRDKIATVTNLNAEAARAQAAEAQLQTNINDEAATREAKDAETLESAKDYADEQIEAHDGDNTAHPYIQGVITALSDMLNRFRIHLDLISSYIMSGTSATNQFAHQEFVNSSIASETANYIKNPETNDVWDSLADLKAYTTTSTVGNNDYAVIQTEVEVDDENADPQYKFDRYKFTKGSTPYADGWGREYTLHPGFTAAQWAALMSGATAAEIAKISILEDAVDALELAVESLGDTKVDKTTKVNGHALSGDVTVTKDDVGLGNVDNTSDLDKPISTATQTALEGKVDKANTVVYSGEYDDAIGGTFTDVIPVVVEE